jgi:hypothetical protein
MARNLDPTSAGQNWATAMQAAGPKIQAGVQRVTTAPGALAAAKSAKYLAGVQDNVQKWQRNVGAVTLAAWQSDMLNKGVARVGTGAQQAQGKYTSNVTPVFSYMANVLNQVDAIDDTTPGGRDQRMLTFAQQMRNYQG